MTDDELAAIRARHAEWDGNTSDDVAALLAEVDRLRQEVADLELDVNDIPIQWPKRKTIATYKLVPVDET